eukprot:SM006496S20142  [mRNA]  locus=s6496:32:832:- [translate_table: standard]
MACLRGELGSAAEALAESSQEILRLRSMLDNLNPSNQFVQLEDYAVRALQVELKAEARRGIVGPDMALMDAPEEYTGCRQFFQSGYCHFGRGRRPCPNEASHFCLQCGRGHGTAPHLILLRRIGDRSLNAGGGPNSGGGGGGCANGSAGGGSSGATGAM